MVKRLKSLTDSTQRKSHKWIMGGALVGSLLLLSAGGHAAVQYKYKNAEGNTVISSTIPADMVKLGYDKVDNYGTLIERVPPQMSDEAYQAKLQREAMIKECKKIHSRVRKLYQFETDIDYAEEQGLESIDQSITNIKANLTVVTSQRQEFETQAAQLDIAGQPIPNALLDNIARAKTQEQNLIDEIDKRYGEKVELRKTHAYDRKVFALENCDNGLPAEDEALAFSPEK